MNDKEFNELEQRYLEEKYKRQELQKNMLIKDELEKNLEKLFDAKTNSFVIIGDMKLSCYISYGDCEGRREIDRDYIHVDLDYEEFVTAIISKLKKVDKVIEEFQSEDHTVSV